MNIFKRKEKNDSLKTDELHDDLSSADTSDSQNLPDEENGLEKVTAEDAEARDNPPSVNLAGREGGNARTFKLMVAGFVGILIMLVGIAFATGKYQKSKEEQKAKDAEKQAQQQKNMVSGSKLDIEREKASMANLPPPADANKPASAVQATVLPPLAKDSNGIDEPVQPIVQPRKTSSPQYSNYSGGNTMVAGRDYAPPAPVEQTTAKSISTYDDPEKDKVNTQLKAQPIELPKDIAKPTPSSVLVDIYGTKTVSTPTQETGLAASMKSSQLANGNAGKRGNMDMLLMRGTTIPCVLKTKINSEYQGFVTCQLIRDVYSANGNVLLMERGSTVFGEQNVQMTQGKARVAILWSKVETPKGVSVSLDSPATGQLGEMGVEAKVNNHFWKRFGGAILLSVIEDSLDIAKTHLEKQDTNGNTTNVTNTTNTVDNMAQDVLKNTINIPPTAIINQGTVINIMVARDVDFGSVYKLERR